MGGLGRATGAAAAVLAWWAGAASAEQATRSTVSSNTVYSIRMVQDSPGHCRVEASRDQAVAWTLAECVAGPNDLLFISNNGERFWILHTLPAMPRVKANLAVHQLEIVVAEERDAGGRILRQQRLRDFVPRRRASRLRDLGLRFGWWEGVAEAPGRGPRVTDDNRVQFESVAGSTTTLDF